MTRVNHPETLLSYIQKLEKRIVVLEGQARLQSASISSGKLLIRDSATGNVIASLAAAAGVDRDGNPYPAGLGASVGSMNGGVIQDGTVGASKVTFSARDLSGITTTLSTTAPASPLIGDLWIDSGNGNVVNRWDGSTWAALPVGTNAIQAGAVTASQIAANTITAGQLAAGAVTASQIAAGAIDGKTITGATIITNSATGGVFIYDGAPATGNLIVSIASEPGTDAYGNTYPQGLSVTAGEIDGTTLNAATITAGSISAGSIGNSTLANCDVQGGTMEHTSIVFDSGGGSLLVYASTTTVSTFTSSGTFVVPAGVTSLAVECWGAGGGGAGGGLAGGANSGGYGGGGGAYAKVSALAVTPGASIPYVVGAGGSGGSANNFGSNGGASSFNSTSCKAAGGTAANTSSRGKGGAASASIGDVKFSGGDGGSATGSGGSGGGEAAGSSANGNPGASNTGSGSASGGSGTAGANGGAGGAANSSGGSGSIPGGGGGGGGGGASAGTGGAGARGQVRVTYTSAQTLVSSVASQAGTDSYGHAYPAGIAGTVKAFDPVAGGAETWHPVSYGTGWSDAVSPVQGVSYRLKPDNTVEFKGAALNNSAAAGQTMFTLPAAYRPPVTRSMECYCRSVTAGAGFSVNPTGAVVIDVVPSGGHTFEFDGLIYSLDA